jgi:regulator of protease activity HflC (stomatin/prohibitin superfamily)
MKSIREWAANQYRRLKAFVRRNVPYLILLFFLLSFLVIFFFDRIVISIHPGELGVLWRWLGGGTQIDTVYREGVHVVLPFNRMYVYNVRRQQFSDTIDVLTVDGLTLKVRYSVRYYLDKDTSDFVNVVVRPEIRSVIRVVFGQYKPEEIYATVKAIQASVLTPTSRAIRTKSPACGPRMTTLPPML